MGFHSMADEYSDTAMGRDFGMLGEFFVFSFFFVPVSVLFFCFYVFFYFLIFLIIFSRMNYIPFFFFFVFR